MRAIQIDSVVTEGENLIYYNFPTFGETEDPFCFTLNGPSWIGGQIKITPDGDNIFYNMDNDSITIKTQAELAEEWICYEFYTGYYIKATVTEIESMTFLGITDMVKKVNFQAMSSDGVPVIHDINDMYLLISENFGLIRTVNFKNFPDLSDFLWFYDCHEYELNGISNPETGIQNLTADEIFNFNIGDEFHINEESTANPNAPFYQSLMTHNIVSKNISNNGDTINYHITRCGLTDYQFYDYDTIHEFSYYNDTINIEYILSQYHYLDTIPYKVITDDYFNDYYEYSYNRQNWYSNTGKLLKINDIRFYSQSPHDCIEYAWPNIDDETYYVQGLGGPFWAWGYEIYSYKKVVYYNIDGEEWGNPYNCDSLLSNVTNNATTEFHVKLAPNPMANSSKLTYSNPKQEKHTLFIYNIFGKKLREQTSTGNMINIEKGNLKKGIFIYTLYHKDTMIHSGKLIIN